MSYPSSGTSRWRRTARHGPAPGVPVSAYSTPRPRWRWAWRAHARFLNAGIGPGGSGLRPGRPRGSRRAAISPRDGCRAYAWWPRSWSLRASAGCPRRGCAPPPGGLASANATPRVRPQSAWKSTSSVAVAICSSASVRSGTASATRPPRVYAAPKAAATRGKLGQEGLRPDRGPGPVRAGEGPGLVFREEQPAHPASEAMHEARRVSHRLGNPEPFVPKALHAPRRSRSVAWQWAVRAAIRESKEELTEALVALCTSRDATVCGESIARR